METNINIKTMDIFKVSYGVTLGFIAAKMTARTICKVVEKLCEVGLDKIDITRKHDYTKDKKEDYIYETSPDNKEIRIKCKNYKTLLEFIKNYEDSLNEYGYVSISDLKQFTDCKFSSFEDTDFLNGWTEDNVYMIESKTNTIVFKNPLDISDLVFDPDKDIEKEDKEDEVEASE